MQDGRELVFVYGTLRRGGSNHFRMEGGEFVAAASAAGRLLHIDWYPGLVLEADGTAVAGEVFAVSAGHLAALDAFEGLSAGEVEGAEYRRVRATVVSGSGELLEAWVWEWRGPREPFEELKDGDWLKNRSLPIK